jgi:hypothetical protein
MTKRRKSLSSCKGRASEQQAAPPLDFFYRWKSGTLVVLRKTFLNKASWLVVSRIFVLIFRDSSGQVLFPMVCIPYLRGIWFEFLRLSIVLRVFFPGGPYVHSGVSISTRS